METILMMCLVTAILLIASCNVMVLFFLISKREDRPKEETSDDVQTKPATVDEQAKTTEQQFSAGLANLLNYDGTKQKEADR